MRISVRRGARMDDAADGEEMAGVLRVHAAVPTDGNRRVAGPEGELQEDLLPDRAPLRDRVEEAILAVDVDGAVRVDGGRVYAPLEALGLRRDAADAAVGSTAAGDGRRVPRLPLQAERRRELRDEVLRYRVDDAAVVVLLDHGRPRAAVLVDRRRDVPPERIRAEVAAVGGKAHQVSLG